MNKKGHVLNAVLLSLGIGYLLEPAGDLETFRTIIMIGVPVTLGALFPDVDTAFGRHRKTLHNLPVLAAFLLFPFYFGNLEYVWIGIATHYVLDVAGSKRGIALFYPIWEREFGLPIGVAVSSNYATLVTIGVTVLELLLIALVIYQIPQVGLEFGQQAFGL